MKFMNDGTPQQVFFERCKWAAHKKTGVKTATIRLSMEVKSSTKGLPAPLRAIVRYMEEDSDMLKTSTAFRIERRNLEFRSAPDLILKAEDFPCVDLEGFEVERDKSGALALKFEFTVRLEEVTAGWMMRTFGNHVWLSSEEAQKELIPLEKEEEADPPPAEEAKKKRKAKETVQ